MKNVEEKEIQDKINQFKIIIQNSKNIVFFGGAGVSTESGIPDLEAKMDYIIKNINIHLR